MNKRELIDRKLHTVASIQPFLHSWRLQDKKIVFTNGCFDLLHLGHIDYLSRAASKGNILIIGVNTDRSVQALKGPSRPITNEFSRTSLLAALFFVDAVILFDEATPLELITAIQPDILIKGSDYTIANIVGADIVLQRGGSVETIDFVPGYSTSSIEQKIKKQA